MKHKIALLILVLALLVFSGCDLLSSFDEDVIEIIGTWDATSSYGTETMEIAADSMSKYWEGTLNYACTITEFSNDGFNAEENGQGDCGYAVIQYSTGQYGILRWQNLNGTSLDFSEAYKDATPEDDSNYDGLYFDTAAEAISTMTAAGGFFGMFTTGAVKQ